MAATHRWSAFPEVQHWLGRLHPNSTNTALTRFALFMDWLTGQLGWRDSTPTSLVTFQKAAFSDPVRQFEILNLLQKYILNECNHMSVETKKQAYTVVRGFFEHNRVSLPRDKSFKIRGAKAPRQVTLDIDSLRQLVLSLREEYRPIGFLLVYSLLDLERFIWFNQHGWHERMGVKGRTPSIREQIERGSSRLKIEFEGRKGNNRPYYTFLGGYGFKVFSDYLSKRGEIKKGEPIFRNIANYPINKRNVRDAFLATAHRLGLTKPVASPCPKCQNTRARRTHSEKNTAYVCLTCGTRYETAFARGENAGVRYGTNPHEVRDVIRSFLHTCKVDKESVEFWMGHEVDELNYNKFFETDPAWCEDQYAEAESYLDQVFLTGKARVEVRTLSKVLEQRETYIRQLEEQLRSQNTRIDGVMNDVRELRRQIASSKPIEKEVPS